MWSSEGAETEGYGELLGCGSVAEVEKTIALLPPHTTLRIAHHALATLIATNFCGVTQTPSLPECLSDATARAAMCVEGNAVYSKARSVPFLHLAHLLVSSPVLEADKREVRLARFRVALAWQKCLCEPAIHIKHMIDKQTAGSAEWGLCDDAAAVFLLERADAHLTFYEYEQSEACVRAAIEESGLCVELAGKMGKRTRFQQHELAQLVLETKSMVRGSTAADDADVPVSVENQDDTVLEEPKLSATGGGQHARPPLSAVQLAAILALCRLEKRSQHEDEILREKIRVYLNEVISHRRGWAVQTAALLCRSENERSKRRYVERACQQAELIVKVMDGVDDKTDVSTRWLRCPLVLPAALEPWWKARHVHADILRSLGCMSEALLSFEQLEMWDEVIECYRAIDQLPKAESLIRRLAEERPGEANLQCMLGDITSNPDYYHKAIEISGDRNARARRALGNLMISRNVYSEAYQHLRRSLEIQPIQLGVWFNAGYSAWTEKQYQDAANCFHRCVSLEPTHFEAWNNLSAAYIRLGQSDRARRILQEALKFNYDHARVWENYILICVQTKEFAQAILGIHRLLDLGKKLEDDELLEMMAGQVKQRDQLLLSDDVTDEMRREQEKLKADTVKLFARLTTAQTISSKVWLGYARLKTPSADCVDVTEWEKYIQLIERALLADSNKPGWQKQSEQCVRVLDTAVLLAEERTRLAKMKDTEEAAKQAKSRIRMSLRALVTAAEKDVVLMGEGDRRESMEAIEKAKQALQEMTA